MSLERRSNRFKFEGKKRRFSEFTFYNNYQYQLVIADSAYIKVYLSLSKKYRHISNS